MSFNYDKIKYYCELAKLGIPDDEIIKIENCLNEISGKMDILEKLSGKDIEPLINVSEGSNVFRHDDMKPSIDREKILSNAPVSDDGCYSVPKLVE